MRSSDPNNQKIGIKAARALYDPEQLKRMATRINADIHLRDTVKNGVRHPGLTTERVREFVETELGWRTVRDALRGAPNKYLKTLSEDSLDAFIDPNVVDDVVGMAKMQEQLEGLPVRCSTCTRVPLASSSTARPC